MPSDHSRRPPGRAAVLVAEDDDNVREFVRIVLEQAGYAVTVAHNGQAAGDLFATDTRAFDLLLTDVVMPLATGVELAARVRGLRPGFPVLFMSAFTGGPGHSPGLLPAGEPLLEKPFTMAELLARVRAAVSPAE